MTAWRRATGLSFAADLAMLKSNSLVEKEKGEPGQAGAGSGRLICDPSLKSMT
jgi:hypothetical protein